MSHLPVSPPHSGMTRSGPLSSCDILGNPPVFSSPLPALSGLRHPLDSRDKLVPEVPPSPTTPFPQTPAASTQMQGPASRPGSRQPILFVSHESPIRAETQGSQKSHRFFKAQSAPHEVPCSPLFSPPPMFVSTARTWRSQDKIIPAMS